MSKAPRCTRSANTLRPARRLVHRLPRRSNDSDAFSGTLDTPSATSATRTATTQYEDLTARYPRQKSELDLGTQNAGKCASNAAPGGYLKASRTYSTSTSLMVSTSLKPHRLRSRIEEVFPTSVSAQRERVPFDVGPAHAKWIEALAGAPGQEDVQVGAGVQPGLAPVTAQVRGDSRTENARQKRASPGTGTRPRWPVSILSQCAGQRRMGKSVTSRSC
jgi:hypothetical protein